MAQDTQSRLQSKKFIGHTYLAANGGTRNVWNSTNLSKLTYTHQLRQLAAFRETYAPSSNSGYDPTLSSFMTSPHSLKQLNYFECSRSWVIKKFYLNTNLRVNSIKIAPLSKKTEPITQSLMSYNGSTSIMQVENQLDQLRTAYTYNGTVPTYETLRTRTSSTDLLSSNNLHLLDAVTMTGSSSLHVMDTLASPTSSISDLTIAFRRSGIRTRTTK